MSRMTVQAVDKDDIDNSFRIRVDLRDFVAFDLGQVDSGPLPEY